ncbi:MAG TPA: hypothetical protein VMT18_04070, partial [Planctomycetota bacterium]|nr:hypothetical protein [Planctomycetota bacterium]
YARRLLASRGLARPEQDLDSLRRFVAQRLVRSQWVHEEFHALCVRAGSRHVRNTVPGTFPPPA